jgi:hypothetical protein
MSKKIVFNVLIVFIIFSMCIPAFAFGDFSFGFYDFGYETYTSPTFAVPTTQVYAVQVSRDEIADTYPSINVYLYEQPTGRLIASFIKNTSGNDWRYVKLNPNIAYYWYVCESNAGQAMTSVNLSVNPT